MWPFSNDDNNDSDFPDRYGMTDVDLAPDARHVDVAILYGLGQEERAQHLACQLRPAKHYVGLPDGDGVDDMTLRRVRDEFKECETNE